MVNHRGVYVVPWTVTRFATLLLACLLSVALLPAAADAAARPALKTQSTPIGTVVTGGNHHTVYVFDLDRRGTHKSACTGACLRAWRPVTFTGTARTHVNAAGITATVRSIPAGRHKRQVTLGGWPLYFYIGDGAAGQVNGQASAGLWWAVRPDGSRIKQVPVDKPVDPTPTPAPGASYTLTTRSTSLGTIVTTGNGMTVYRYDGDTANDASCAGCSPTWPALKAAGSLSMSGVSGTVSTAPDGQVMVNGWRLYTYAYDYAPGDVNGESSALWSAVNPDGTKVKG